MAAKPQDNVWQLLLQQLYSQTYHYLGFFVNFRIVTGLSIESKTNVELSSDKTQYTHEFEIEVDNQIV